MRLHVMALLGFLASARPAAPMMLYVDKDSKGGPCSDSYARAQNDAAHPWCTLGQAGIAANTPGDTVLVRSSAHPYSEIAHCWDAASGMACGNWAVLEPQHKGTASAPITFTSYPGEQAVIDPDGTAPTAGGGLIYGLMVGGGREPGRCSGGARSGLTCQDNSQCSGATCVTRVCYAAGAQTGAACATDTDCGTGVCRRVGWYLVVDGFRFSHWDFWDSSPTATAGAHVPSQYAISLPQSNRPHAFVTIQHCELASNNGGGVLHYNGSFGLLFQNNLVHDNATHGWTTAVNLWQTTGWTEQVQNVVRGNTIDNNIDTPPTWCLSHYCAGGTNTCEDTVNGRGDRCPCMVNSDCESGVCQQNIPGASGCDQPPWHDGDTEGNGIIVDVPQGVCKNNPTLNCTWAGDAVCGSAGCAVGEAGYVLVEYNTVFDNWGYGINAFEASHVTIHNNTLVENGRRNTLDYNGEIVAWSNGGQVHNNIAQPRAKGQCECATDADCGGAAGSCWNNGPSWGAVCRNGSRSVCTADGQCAPGRQCTPVQALRLTYGPSSIYAADPTTMGVGGNVLYSTAGPEARLMRVADPGAQPATTVAVFQTSADAIAYGWAGNGGSKPDLQAAPLFVDPSSADFRLQAASPAIGAGDPAFGDATAGALGVAGSTTTTVPPSTTTLPPTTTTSTTATTSSTTTSTTSLTAPSTSIPTTTSTTPTTTTTGTTGTSTTTTTSTSSTVAAPGVDLRLDPSAFLTQYEVKNALSPLYQVLPMTVGPYPFNSADTAQILPCGVQNLDIIFQIVSAPGGIAVYPQATVRFYTSAGALIVSRGYSGGSSIAKLTIPLTALGPGAAESATATVISSVSPSRDSLFQPKDLQRNSGVRMEITVAPFADPQFTQRLQDANPDNDVINFWIMRAC
jgi:hypothetical protein